MSFEQVQEIRNSFMRKGLFLLITEELLRTHYFLRYFFRFSVISSGLQYVVFDCRNGRVAKLERPLLLQITLTWKWYGQISLRRFQHIRTVNRDRNYVPLLIDHILKDGSGSEFANPSVIRFGYLQDRCVTVEDRLKSAGYDCRSEVIEEILDVSKRHAGAGILDKSFNFHLNFGFDDSGKMVCLDLGELIPSLSELMEIQRTETWRSKAFWRTLLLTETQRIDRDLPNILSSYGDLGFD